MESIGGGRDHHTSNRFNVRMEAPRGAYRRGTKSFIRKVPVVEEWRFGPSYICAMWLSQVGLPTLVGSSHFASIFFFRRYLCIPVCGKVVGSPIRETWLLFGSWNGK